MGASLFLQPNGHSALPLAAFNRMVFLLSPLFSGENSGLMPQAPREPLPGLISLSLTTRRPSGLMSPHSGRGATMTQALKKGGGQNR